MDRDAAYRAKEGTEVDAFRQHVDQLLRVLERLRHEIDERVRVREILASNLPKKIHDFLKVPNRAYGLLFSRLPGQADQHVQSDRRIATFNLGQGCLTAVQVNHMFLFASHAQPELRPGVSEKLLAVTNELSKMYPA
jgi:hypothetical protein